MCVWQQKKTVPLLVSRLKAGHQQSFGASPDNHIGHISCSAAAIRYLFSCMTTRNSFGLGAPALYLYRSVLIVGPHLQQDDVTAPLDTRYLAPTCNGDRTARMRERGGGSAWPQ